MSRLFLRTRRGDESGAAAIETAVFFVIGFPLFVVLLVVGGRLALAKQTVEHAADQAARNASIARTSSQAQRFATSAAQRTMKQRDLHCSSYSVNVNTSGFSSQVGDDAFVSAEVVCTVSFSDVGIPGMPGSKTVRARFVSPLDTYRERR